MSIAEHWNMLNNLEAMSSRTRPWLLGRAENLCGARADAEDLVQETFTRFVVAFGGAAQLPGETRCVSWLVATMTNCFYDQLRRRRVREQSAADPALELEPECSPDSMDGSPCDRISQELLNGTIQALSPPLRSAIVMYLTGRKQHEIARQLGISRGAVAKRLYDGRAKLRLLLGPTVH